MNEDAASGRRSIVYVGCAGSNEIHVLSLDAVGGLAPLAVVALPGVGEPGPSTPLALSPDRRFLYAGVRSLPHQVLAFSIDPSSGALTHLGNAPLADSMAYLALDRVGRYLLSASYGGNRIAVNPIGPDGRVQPPQQVVPTGPRAHAILTDPSNRVALASSLGGDLLHRFRFDAATGRLAEGEPAARVEPGSGPRHFVFHPKGHLLFLLNELSATINVFGIGPAGGPLQPLQTCSALPEGFTGTPWAADLHLTPDGRFLYASERASSTLQAFRVDPERGTLSPCGSTPTEAQPRGFAIDPSGGVLVAAGETSHRITSYIIDPDSGRLVPIAQRGVGLSPNWVEILDLRS